MVRACAHRARPHERKRLQCHADLPLSRLVLARRRWRRRPFRRCGRPSGCRVASSSCAPRRRSPESGGSSAGRTACSSSSSPCKGLFRHQSPDSVSRRAPSSPSAASADALLSSYARTSHHRARHESSRHAARRHRRLQRQRQHHGQDTLGALLEVLFVPSPGSASRVRLRLRCSLVPSSRRFRHPHRLFIAHPPVSILPRRSTLRACTHISASRRH